MFTRAACNSHVHLAPCSMHVRLQSTHHLDFFQMVDQKHNFTYRSAPNSTSCWSSKRGTAVHPHAQMEWILAARLRKCNYTITKFANWNIGQMGEITEKEWKGVGGQLVRSSMGTVIKNMNLRSNARRRVSRPRPSIHQPSAPTTNALNWSSHGQDSVGVWVRPPFFLFLLFIYIL